MEVPVDGVGPRVTITSNTLWGITVGVLLAVLAVPAVASALARSDDGRSRYIFPVALAGGLLKVAMAPVYIFVTDHFYGGVADYRTYSTQGAIVGSLIRKGDFSFHVGRFLGDGATSIITGVVYAIVGHDQLAVFFVFAFGSYVALTLFYRAFRKALPGGDTARYAALIFFLPSLLFWTSAIGKDAIISVGIATAATGAARIFNRERAGYLLVALGLSFAGIIRPHDSLIFFTGFACAYLVTKDKVKVAWSAGRRVAGAAVLAVGAVILVKYTERFLGLHSFSLSAIHKALEKNAVNTGAAATNQVGDFASSRSASASLSPLALPVDIYDVIIRPLPFRAHGIPQLVSSFQNLFVVGLFAVSLRRLSAAARLLRREPYLLLCLVYSLVWVVLYASIGNLGILAREESSFTPLLVVGVCATFSARPAGVDRPARTAASAGA